MTRQIQASAFAAVLATVAFLAPGTSAQAQGRGQGVGNIANGLLNVQVGAVIGDITIGDITILQDLIDGGVINIDDITLNDVDLVDIDTINVTDVLNRNQIRVLSNFLNRSPILSNNSDFLNDLLRDANIITGNQTVVGILNGLIVIAPIDIL